MLDENQVKWLNSDGLWSNAFKIEGSFQQFHDSLDRYFDAVKVALEAASDLENKQSAYKRRESLEIISSHDFDELVKATNDVFDSQAAYIVANENVSTARNSLFTFGLFNRWIKHNDLAVAIVEFDGLEVVAEQWDAEFVLVRAVQDHPTQPLKWHSAPVHTYAPSSVGLRFVRSIEWARKTASEPEAF